MIYHRIQETKINSEYFYGKDVQQISDFLTKLKSQKGFTANYVLSHGFSNNF